MCVFTPWLNPAVNRSFQAAEAWEGAARAIRVAAQSAASAAVVRGKIQLLPFPTAPRSRIGRGGSSARGTDLPSPYGGLTNPPAAVSGGGTLAEAAGSRAAS